MNYTELCEAIEDTCEDDFEAGALARFVRQAEQRIYTEAQIPSLRKLLTGSTLTSGDRYIATPTDFIAVFSLAVIASSRYYYLLEKEVDFLREAYPVPTTTGRPKFCATFGAAAGDAKELRLMLGPTPDANYSYELHYYYYPESIVTATNTWLGDNFDSVLFNGALIEAARFQKAEADTIKSYQELYMESMSLLKKQAGGKQRTEPYRKRGRE